MVGRPPSGSPTANAITCGSIEHPTMPFNSATLVSHGGPSPRKALSGSCLVSVSFLSGSCLVPVSFLSGPSLVIVTLGKDRSPVPDSPSPNRRPRLTWAAVAEVGESILPVGRRASCQWEGILPVGGHPASGTAFGQHHGQVGPALHCQHLHAAGVPHSAGRGHLVLR